MNCVSEIPEERALQSEKRQKTKGSIGLLCGNKGYICFSCPYGQQSGPKISRAMTIPGKI